MGFSEEQNEILRLSDELDGVHGRGWLRYKGDTIARKVIALLSGYLVNYGVAGPNVYVKGFPIELDALIVERTSSPIQGTAAYRAGDVRVVIEIKKHGFYFKKREAGEKISEYFARLRDIGKPFIYLTVKESATMRNGTSAVLESDSFFLCESPNRVIPGQWQGFVERVIAMATG